MFLRGCFAGQCGRAVQHGACVLQGDSALGLCDHKLLLCAHDARQGNGVPMDDALAIEWFRLAAAQGDEPSQNALFVLGKWARNAEKRRLELE